MRLEVFDEDFIPDRIRFRESQMDRIAMNFSPAEFGSRATNTICLGTPATGKTTVVKYLLNQLQNAKYAYVNCQISKTKQQIFFKIFDSVVGFYPQRGVSLQKVISETLKKLSSPLIVVLDDAQFAEDRVIEETIISILKAHEVVSGVKTSVVVIATDPKYIHRFSPDLLSIFHPDEVYFPPYGEEEIRQILLDRVRMSYLNFERDAFEEVVRETFNYADLRYGLSLMKQAAIVAWREGKERIDFECVESAKPVGKIAFFKKLIAALDEKERSVLKAVYSSKYRKAAEIFSEVSGMGYTKFTEILKKLEYLRLIDVVTKFERGLSSVVIRRFDSEDVLRAIEALK